MHPREEEDGRDEFTLTRRLNNMGQPIVRARARD